MDLMIETNKGKADPWENIDSKYAVGSKHIAKICSTKNNNCRYQ